MKNTMTKAIALLWEARANPFLYVKNCAEYYKRKQYKGITLSGIICKEYDAMIQFKKDVDASAAS